MEGVMKVCLRAPAWAAVLCLATRVATAQVIPWPRGDRLVADARVDSARYDVTGGVLLLRYTLTIDPASEQHARVFVVQARAPVVSVRAPEPARSWVTVGPQPGDSVAFWGSASRQQDVAPGVSRPGFELRARGLPGVARFWVEGRYDAPTVSPADEDRVAEAPRVEDNSFTGLTIGIESVDIPAASGLLARLRGLVTRSCGLHWVTTEGVCHSLEVKLDQAQASLERGNAAAARAQLEAFLNELDAQHGPEPGKHVTDNGFWLLKINAAYVVSRL